RLGIALRGGIGFASAPRWPVLGRLRGRCGRRHRRGRMRDRGRRRDRKRGSRRSRRRRVGLGLGRGLGLGLRKLDPATETELVMILVLFSAVLTLDHTIPPVALHITVWSGCPPAVIRLRSKVSLCPTWSRTSKDPSSPGTSQSTNHSPASPSP